METEEEMTQNTAEETPQEEGERVIYELGYHVIPTLDEEQIAAEVKKMRDSILQKKGNIISEGSPRKIDLAYTVAQNMGGTYRRFDNAYFGWIKFEMLPSSSALLQAEIKGNQNVLRFLLIKTTREDAAPQKKVFLRREEPKSAPIRKLTQKEEKAPVSEEELDKQIEEMVAEK